MKKTSILIAALAALLGLAAAERNSAGQDYRSLQLVYHSDTRGYIRPCG